MNKHNYPMGSVSSGTMRPQDLFEAFTSAFEYLDKEKDIKSGLSRFDEFRRENQDVFAIENYDDMTDEQSESLDYAVEALFDILNEFAGPYFYFGSHPGDGANYGFWFSDESFEDAVHCGEVFKVDDLSAFEFSAPTGFEYDYVAVISDHGNITLYNLNGEEVWSIV